MSKNRELGVNMIDVVEILAARKTPILAFAFAVAMVTAIISLVVPFKYRAATVLMPPTGSSENSFTRILRNVPLGKIGGMNRMLGNAPSDMTSTYMAILGSRALRLDLIREFNLAHVYKFDKQKRYFIEDLLKAVNKNLGVSLDDENGTIAIQVVDQDPQRAADMANYMVRQLDEIYKRLMTEKNRNYRVFLGERLDLVKADLLASEENLVKFQKQNRMMDFEAQAKATISAGVSLEARYLAARGNLEVASMTFSEDHPKVRELRIQLNQLEKQRREISSDRISDFFVPYTTSPDIALEYLRLRRDFGIQNTIFDLLLQQHEEAKFEESKNTPTVQVLDPAEPPQKRIFPKRRKMVQLAFLVSLLAACIAGLLAEHARRYRDGNPAGYARIAGIARQLWIVRIKR